jgi:crotonobetainyl-CoA:carnitine CoA-transferase CaiB-like acyl-CoA transferase
MTGNETLMSSLGNASRSGGPLGNIRICDMTGQLAGAGSTRVLAAFGAQVIRVEDPVRKGGWDILRQLGPWLHDENGPDHSPEGGSGFNNHNVEKLGITINLRTERGRELLAELVRVSNAVTENFAAGVMARLGFSYERLRELRPDIVYVSTSGFGHEGPYSDEPFKAFGYDHPFKAYGPIFQAMSGLTHTSGLPGLEPAGWGYSYMDHTGAYTMAIGLLAALYHQRRTGEGQWVDVACVESGMAHVGLAGLDASVNRRDERAIPVNSNREMFPPMAPSGIYPCRAEDSWVALGVRDDREWSALGEVIGAAWAVDARFAGLTGRQAGQDELDRLVGAWTRTLERDDVVEAVRSRGVPCAPVLRPGERCDRNPDNDAWGLWPTVVHSKHGPLRVDGLPVHLSSGDWQLERGGPLLGEHNERVFGEVLGLSSKEIAQLSEEGVI